MPVEPSVAGAWRIGTAEIDGVASAVVAADGEMFSLDALLGASRPGIATLDLLADWTRSQARIVAALESRDAPSALDPDEIAWLPPIVYPRKLLMVGANYRDHVIEMGGDPDAMPNPYVFLKPASTSLRGSGRETALPPMAEWVDWEAELGVVIGADGSDSPVVAGYTILNDISARDWNDRPAPNLGIDWMLQKGFDGFTPAGPLITPAAFVADPHDLEIELTVNGEVKQQSSTAQLIFDVDAIVAHLRSILTLEPGDIIGTGTPVGVGWGRSPRERLLPGDEVTVRIAGLGELSTRFRATEDAGA
jgi:2,4-didehydro-3-deoxy-L-rhamnonate hydrolase